MNRLQMAGCLLLLVAGTYVAWSLAGTGDTKTPPPIELTVDSAADLSAGMREAFLAGRPVRVHYEATQGELSKPTKTKEYWSRKLTAGELKRAEKLFGRWVKASNKQPDLEGKSALEQETLLAQSKKHSALATTSLALLKEGKAFLTKGPILALKSTEDWHYWNVTFRTKPEGNVIIYVPIDLSKYPHVRSARNRSKDLREFTVTEEGYKWNSLPYDERRRLVEAEKELRTSIDRAALSLEELSKKKATGPLTQDEIDQMAALQVKITEARARYVKVPRKLDPLTLEWRR